MEVHFLSGNDYREKKGDGDEADNRRLGIRFNSPEAVANYLRKSMKKGRFGDMESMDKYKLRDMFKKLAERNEGLLEKGAPKIPISMMEFADLVSLLLEDDEITYYPGDIGKTFWESGLPAVVKAKQTSDIGDVPTGGDIIEQMCRRCKEVRKLILTSIQTRGNDEGTTTFLKCTACGDKWKG